MTRVYFATNRNPNNRRSPTSFGKRFSHNGLTDLRFGYAEVVDKEITKLHVAKEKLKVPKSDAERGNLEDQVLGSEAIFQMIHKDMVDGNRDTLIYIHGFANSFKSTIKRAAEIKQFYASHPLNIIVFTWPGDDSMMPFLAYMSDRDDAKASGVALGRGMQKMAHFLRKMSADDYCDQKLHLLAHSMGNYALRHAVQSIDKSSGGNVRRIFDQVFLMAADEDDDALEQQHKLKPLRHLAERITVYTNPKDLALTISDRTKDNPDRLGAGGPQNSRAIPDKMTIVNCQDVISSHHDKTGHQYYRNNSRVQLDVLAVLKGTEQSKIEGREYVPETRSFRIKL